MTIKAYLSFIISLCLLAITITPVYSATTMSNETVFGWIEYKFADLFPRSITVKSDLTHEGVHYDLRSWSGAWGTRYLGVTDAGEIIGLGDYTQGELKSFGYIDDWKSQIQADMSNPRTITIPAPEDYYNFACSDPSIQFVLPVNINDDNQSDFIVHYWCDANPYGSVVTEPTADALVAQVSQPDGSYAVANEEVFGANHIGLGGASRKVKRGDINGDGYDDFAFAMNYEDGRYNADPNVCNTEPSVLMSTGSGTYEVVRLGHPGWGHAVGIVNNTDGTVEVFFSGFTGANFQAFKYVNGEYVDVTDTYPSDAGNWATGAKSIDVNGVTEYIIGTWDSYDGSNPEEERLIGAKLYKRSGNSWVDVGEYGIPIDFSTPQISWSGTAGTVNVSTIEGEQYFGCSLEGFEILKGGLSGYDDDLIVGKMAAAELINSGSIIEGVAYNENDTAPVNIYQFFEFSDAGLRLIDSPIINEEIDVTLNFFKAEDISGDNYPDLVSYAFTTPWSDSRVEEDGKPIVYLNDGNGNLVWTDISELPGFNVNDGSQSILQDVDNDDIVDLVLYGLRANPGSGDIVIHILEDYME